GARGHRRGVGAIDELERGEHADQQDHHGHEDLDDREAALGGCVTKATHRLGLVVGRARRRLEGFGACWTATTTKRAPEGPLRLTARWCWTTRCRWRGSRPCPWWRRCG